MKIYDVIGIGANLTGSFSGSFKGLFTGPLDGVAATSSYVEYTDVANKPALVSGSSQVLAFNVFATTGSNQFNGNQSITGSLTVTGQVIAQTLNVQQVTSSIVFSSGSNRFGNNSGNTHQFTGSVRVTGSLTVNGSGLVPYTGATQEVNLGSYSISANSLLANQITVNPSGTTAAQVFLKHGSSFSLPNGFGSIGSSTGNEFRLYQVSSGGVWRAANISLNSITASATRTYTLPDASGTLALSADLGAYLPLAGGTLTGALNGTSAVFTGAVKGNGIEITNTANADILDIFQSPSVLNSFIDYPSGRSLILRNKANGFGLTLASTGAATFTQTGGSFLITADGQFISKQNLDVATAGGRFTGQSARGTMGQIQIDQVTTGADGGRITLSVSPSGSTTPATALTLASTGAATFSSSVGIGASPNARLEVTSGSPESAEVQRWSYNVNGNPDFSLRLRQDVSEGLVKHVFDVVNSGTNFTNNLVLTNGSVGIGTATPAATVKLDVVGDIRTSTGILFGADTAAANALDDYEEGSWTPVVGGTTGNPTVSYITQLGKYVKIGRVVHIFCQLRLSSSSGGSGNLIITGLPYTVSGDSDETGGSIGLALGFATLPTVLQPEGTTSYIYVMVNELNTPITDLDFTYFNFTLTYLHNT